MASFSNENRAGFGTDGFEPLCEDDTDRNCRTVQSSLRAAFYSDQNTVVPFGRKMDWQSALMAAGFALVVLLLTGITLVISKVEVDRQNRKFTISKYG